jgi:hypothetical protein
MNPNLLIDIPPFELADVISVANGLLVFVSVLSAGSDNSRRRRTAWAIGLSVQLLLVLFGWLTVHYGFFVNLIPGAAFAWNLIRSCRKPKPLKDIKVISDEAKAALEEALPRLRAGGVVKGPGGPFPKVD